MEVEGKEPIPLTKSSFSSERPQRKEKIHHFMQSTANDFFRSNKKTES